MKKQSLPVLITVDVEPSDKQPLRVNPNDWHGVEQVAECLNNFRKRGQQNQREVRFSWFWRMDPQIAEVHGTPIWAVQRFRKLIANLSANGDEFGLHTHNWIWDEGRKLWFENFADSSWVNHCLQVSFAAYRDGFGAECKSFRFGGRWMSNSAVAELDRLGALYDLTVEPDSDWELTEPHLGNTANFDSAPVFPYHPAQDDFVSIDATGQRNLWMIPMTTVQAELPLEFRPDFQIRRKGGLARFANKLAKRLIPQFAVFYEGSLDWATPETIYGWVYNPNNPNQVLEVDIYDGDRLLTRVVANGFRPDLAELGFGDGCHSFWLPAPSQLRDGKQHRVHAKIAGYDFDLESSPKFVSRTNGEKLQRGTVMPYLDSHPSFFRQVIDTLLNDEKRKHLAFVVRSDVGAKKEALAHFRQNLDYLATHAELNRLRFITPAELGQYVPEMSHRSLEGAK